MLNEVVNKEFITHPAVILRRLRKDIVKTLRQSTEIGEMKDGMDMAVVSIDIEKLQLQYSGANNPLYIIRKKKDETNGEIIIEKTELIELKPDKMPISIYDKMDKFNIHEFKLEQGDKVYMFSDGYADQFGGEKGRKLMYKHFKNLLLETSSLDMHQQGMLLESRFKQWRGIYDQIDDVTVMGIEI